MTRDILHYTSVGDHDEVRVSARVSGDESGIYVEDLAVEDEETSAEIELDAKQVRRIEAELIASAIEQLLDEWEERRCA